MGLSPHGQAALTPSAEFKSPSLLPPCEAGSPMRATSLIDTMPTYVKELIAGGAAGGFAKTVVAPLERTKILYQTQHAMFRSLGIMNCLKFIHRKEGLLGFYKGNGASVIRVVPYAALHFMTYEQYGRWIADHYPAWAPSGAVVDLLAGSLAGGTAVLCTYPLDLARTMLAFQISSGAAGSTNGPASYKGIVDVFRKVFKTAGFRGLYRGIGPTLYGMLPYAGLKFYVYERLKGQLSEDQKSSVTMKLACGAVAGMVAQTATYPLDVVRRQMQVQAVSVSNQGYTSTANALATIARTQGMRQLFAGLSINYIKLVPSVAIGFATYDSLKSLLRVPVRNKERKTIVT